MIKKLKINNNLNNEDVNGSHNNLRRAGVFKISCPRSILGRVFLFNIAHRPKTHSSLINTRRYFAYPGMLRHYEHRTQAVSSK